MGIPTAVQHHLIAGPGESLWTAGVFLAAAGMTLQGATTLWTIVRLRGVTMMRIPVFCWAQLVTCLMVAAAFRARLTADAIVAPDRTDPSLLSTNQRAVRNGIAAWDRA